jgi:hypothetical protein
VHGDGHGRAHVVPPAWAGQLVFPAGLDWRNEAVGWTVAQHCYSIFPFFPNSFPVKILTGYLFKILKFIENRIKRGKIQSKVP